MPGMALAEMFFGQAVDAARQRIVELIDMPGAAGRVVPGQVAQPGRTVPQVARMPDGRAYLWVARTVARGGGGWGVPGKEFSVALGCDIRHAPQLVYSRGLHLANSDAAVPIGMGCKVCERDACPQRAFPPIGRALDVNENHSRFAPYPVAAPLAATHRS